MSPAWEGARRLGPGHAPWDRLIVGTSLALDAPLVTRDTAIRATGLVDTIW